MLYGVKSPGPTDRLSVTVKLFSQRRKYPASTDSRGRICCWTDTPNCQSLERTLHPSRIFGSIAAVVSAVVPKVCAFIAPQISPPDADRFCAAGLFRSQSGTKLLFESVHERAVVVAMRPIGFDRM